MTRIPLPLLNGDEFRHGSRSLKTCLYKCGNECDHPQPNRSDNPEISEVIEKTLARRALLKGGAVGMGALVVGGITPSLASAATAAPARHHGRPRQAPTLGRAEFTPLAPKAFNDPANDDIFVPVGFRYDLVAAWGDPVTRDAPAFDAYRQTEESAARQFGYNADYVGFLPTSRHTGVLFVDHEYTNEELMFPVGTDADLIRRIAIQSHGASIIEVTRNGKRGWKRSSHRRARLNRRITGTTRFELVGPAAGDARMKTSADAKGRFVLGTLNNCSGGTTPWGTFLSGEENFNQYFESGSGTAPTDPGLVRLGFSASSARHWNLVDPRFDLDVEPNEPNRFGWIIEVDPFDPKSTPVKHTMLGRFKHEGANIQIARNGKAVAYMGDDQAGDYLYKFVSRDTYRPGAWNRGHNKRLLTRGTLYVAKFTADGDGESIYDGSGVWIPLTSDTRSYVPGFSVADVLINTRLAADAVGPTKLDRPEDVQPNPVNGRIYAALTNNSGRTGGPVTASPVDRATVNSAFGGPTATQSGNRNGYVLELTETRGDHTATTFAWDLFLVCGLPDAPETYFAGVDKAQVSPISCPDNVAFDAEGNLWISTDGAYAPLKISDGLYRVPVSGPERGQVQLFAIVPIGAECCGPLVTPDQLSVFLAPQHPGEQSGSTFENPTSTWPHTHPFPRPGVAVAYQMG